MKLKILFVEDEPNLGNVIKQYLEVMDFEIDWYTNGKTALHSFREKSHQYDILVIDIRLPDMNGVELAEMIGRIDNTIPFLFLTAHDEKPSGQDGLHPDADNYITKPFEIDELVLRIRKVLHRNQVSNKIRPGINTCGDIVLYKDQFKIAIAGDALITLTQREFELLEYLIGNRNKILKREEILQELWGENDYFLGRSLDVIVSRLRKHLHASRRVFISSVYGVGFILQVQD